MDATERVNLLEKDIGAIKIDVTGLKKDVADLKTDVAVIKSNYVTKGDLADAKASIIMWVVSAIFLAQLLPGLMKKFGL